MSSTTAPAVPNGHDLSLRDLILGLQPPKPHPIPGLLLGGEQVYGRKWTGVERDIMEAQAKKLGDNDAAWRGRIVANTLCDAAGRRLFAIEEAAQLNGLDADFLEMVIKWANTFNFYGQAGIEAAEKNSAPAPSESSSSAS